MKYQVGQFILEQSILKMFKFSIAGDLGLSSTAGQRTRFFCCFFRSKNGTVGSYKTGSVGKPYTHVFLFFFGLSGSYNISSQIEVSHLFNTGGRVALSSDYF